METIDPSKAIYTNTPPKVSSFIQRNPYKIGFFVVLIAFLGLLLSSFPSKKPLSTPIFPPNNTTLQDENKNEVLKNQLDSLQKVIEEKKNVVKEKKIMFLYLQKDQIFKRI